MNGSWYRGDGNRHELPAERPSLADRARRPQPGDYLADAGLVSAVNAALLLNQPLLLTGEPGTGKSQLAYSVAWELNAGQPLRFNTKSTSTARDLFYSYDSLARFHAAQTGGTTDAWRFVRLNALGLAILLTNEPGELYQRFVPEGSNDGKRRSVVLIDEIDKAPRDFPNDVLNELEDNEFQILELDNLTIAADPRLPPVLIVTSNSERDLPDAFLRRCVYYNVPFPDKERLSRIVERRLGQYAGGSSQFLDDALELLGLLRRKGTGLRKPPSTAEFLGWLAALRSAAPEVENPLEPPAAAALETLSILVKTAEDQSRGEEVLARWVEARTPKAAPGASTA